MENAVDPVLEAKYRDKLFTQVRSSLVMNVVTVKMSALTG